MSGLSVFSTLHYYESPVIFFSLFDVVTGPRADRGRVHSGSTGSQRDSGQWRTGGVAAGEPQRDHNREIAVLANRNRAGWCVSSSAVPIAHEPPRGIRSGEMAAEDEIPDAVLCTHPPPPPSSAYTLVSRGVSQNTPDLVLGGHACAHRDALLPIHGRAEPGRSSEVRGKPQEHDSRVPRPIPYTVLEENSHQFKNTSHKGNIRAGPRKSCPVPPAGSYGIFTCPLLRDLAAEAGPLGSGKVASDLNAQGGQQNGGSWRQRISNG